MVRLLRTGLWGRLEQYIVSVGGQTTVMYVGRHHMLMYVSQVRDNHDIFVGRVIIFSLYKNGSVNAINAH